MSNENVTKSEIIIERFKEALGLRFDREVCERLKIKANTLSGWKTRGSLDYDTIFSNCENISIHWLVTGEGPMRLDETSEGQYNTSESKYLDGGEENSEVDKWKEKCLELSLENRDLRLKVEALGGNAQEKPESQGRRKKVV